MSRRRAEVVALVLVVALVAVGYWASRFFAEESIPSDISRQRFSEGEWLVLDNKAAVEHQRSEGVSEKFLDAYPFGDFTGVLELRIDSVTLWDSPEAAGVAYDDLILTSYDGEWDESNYCEIVYTVINVSAQPRSGSVKSGREGFNNSALLRFGEAGQRDQVYFDGMIEGGSLEAGDGNIFSIAPGEQRTFTSGYAIEGNEAPGRIDVGMGWGYTIDVQCEDRRSAAQ